jgi:hypothetical protein
MDAMDRSPINEASCGRSLIDPGVNARARENLIEHGAPLSQCRRIKEKRRTTQSLPPHQRIRAPHSCQCDALPFGDESEKPFAQFFPTVELLDGAQPDLVEKVCGSLSIQGLLTGAQASPLAFSERATGTAVLQ